MRTERPFDRFGIFVLVLAVALALGASRLVSAQVVQPPSSQRAIASLCSDPLNALINPCFETSGTGGTGPFYFRVWNSFVADSWMRWWIYGDNDEYAVPEFLDGLSHGESYAPPPEAGGHSQAYIKYGVRYLAGVWQFVSVTPCEDYDLQGYVRVDGAYHPKVGINPLGWKPPERPGDYGCYSYEHPVQCYKEGLHSWADMSTATIWSEDVNPPKYTWAGPLSVTAEALSTTVSVWTYSAPDSGVLTTYWDYMSLYRVPRQTPLAPTGIVFAPDSSLDPTVITGTITHIEWTTSRPAFSQVFYRVHSTSTVSTTLTFSNTTFLPLVMRGGQVNVSDFAYHTEPTSAMGTNHLAALVGLESGQTYDYMAAVRWFDGSTCVSTGSNIGTFTAP